MNLEHYLAERRERVDETLLRLLPAEQGHARTALRAVRYAVLGPGKRLRPIVALAVHEACGGSAGDADEPAAALEMIHAYSLTHDDLPAMDDDDMRRGRPSVHRAFGDAQAILAGDALLTLAFEVLGSLPESAPASHRADAVVAAARGAGIAGMVGGQVADLEAEHASVDARRLDWIHRHKTGALFAAGAEVGAIHAGATPERRAVAWRYGEALGLAFQIADDLLDRTANSRWLGKTAGKDQRSGKATYPELFGLDGSRRQAEEIVGRALDELKSDGLLTPPLAALAEYAVCRKR